MVIWLVCPCYTMAFLFVDSILNNIIIVYNKAARYNIILTRTDIECKISVSETSMNENIQSVGIKTLLLHPEKTYLKTKQTLMVG